MTISKISNAARLAVQNNILAPSASKIIQRQLTTKKPPFEISSEYISLAIKKQNEKKEAKEKGISEKTPQEKLKQHIKEKAKEKETQLIQSGYEILDAKKAGRQWESILTDAYKMQQADSIKRSIDHSHLEKRTTNIEKRMRAIENNGLKGTQSYNNNNITRINGYDNNGGETAYERLEQLENKIRILEIEKIKSKFYGENQTDSSLAMKAMQDRLHQQEKRIKKLERNSFAQARNIESVIQKGFTIQEPDLKKDASFAKAEKERSKKSGENPEQKER